MFEFCFDTVFRSLRGKLIFVAQDGERNGMCHVSMRSLKFYDPTNRIYNRPVQFRIKVGSTSTFGRQIAV